MPKQDIFFLFVLSFLSGIACASFGLPLMFSLPVVAVVFAVFFISNIDWRVALIAAVLLTAGSAFYAWDDHRYQAAISHVPEGGEVQGTVSSDPKRGADYQSFYISSAIGTLLVEEKPAPAYRYGDSLTLQGKIEPPPQQYFSKHIVGLMRNPRVSGVSSPGGNPILRILFGMKERMRSSFQQTFQPEQSALLFGILFGVNDDFSKQFSQDLSQSGLRFITAIDGLHMQIVIMIVFGAFSYLAPRRYAFILTFIFVAFFVALTGFSVSGIRASLMAFIASLAGHTGRIYAPHTALALAALVLALLNPKTLVFDVGFQLSFLAALAIIYFLPVLQRALHLGDEPGVLGWKQSLLITISAQLFTAPLIISQFQTFSLTSFAASVLIVWLLPFLIVFGFLIALCALLFLPLAFLLALIVAPLIEYVIVIIELFARFAFLFNPPLGFVGTVSYYGSLLFVTFSLYRAPLRAAPEKRPEERAARPAIDFEIIEIP